MEKAFWQSIRQHDFRIPDGCALPALTDELIAALGSPDPDLRDGLACTTLTQWIAREAYDAEALADLVKTLMPGLRHGIGERETDSVFRRSFSALILAEAVAHDSVARSLPPALIREALGAALAYLTDEVDLRGYVCDKGWAHAGAHGADLLRALAGHPALGTPDLEAILRGMGERLNAANPYPFLSSEEDRLASAAVAVFRRGQVPLSRTASWFRAMAANTPGAASPVQEQRVARHNTKVFLFSLHAMLAWQEPALPGSVALQAEVEEAIRTLLPWV